MTATLSTWQVYLCYPIPVSAAKCWTREVENAIWDCNECAVLSTLPTRRDIQRLATSEAALTDGFRVQGAEGNLADLRGNHRRCSVPRWYAPIVDSFPIASNPKVKRNGVHQWTRKPISWSAFPQTRPQPICSLWKFSQEKFLTVTSCRLTRVKCKFFDYSWLQE